MIMSHATTTSRSPYEQSERERHVREAAAFTREVGGTDQDVKAWFFNLDESALRQVMDAYERSHGSLRRSYAEETLPAWRSGTRRMSGMVAKRLYALLPPLMNARDRLALVESLWNHVAPKRQAVCVCGPDAEPCQIHAAVLEKLTEMAAGHDIPENFARRFRWLAGQDVAAYQVLANRFLELDRLRAATAAAEVSRAVTPHLSAGSVHRLHHTVCVDGVSMTIIFDPAASGVAVRDGVEAASRRREGPVARTTDPSSDSQESGWAWFLGIAVVLAVVIALAH